MSEGNKKQARKKLFVAIPPPAEMKTKLLSVNKYSKKTKDIRWISFKKLHITVCFIGEVTLEVCGEIRKILKNVFNDTVCFNMDFERLRVVPDAKRPRMFWAVFSQGSGEYNRIVKEVRVSLKKFINAEFGHKQAIPHVTLARIKSSNLPEAGLNLLIKRLNL